MQAWHTVLLPNIWQNRLHTDKSLARTPCAQRVCTQPTLKAVVPEKTASVPSSWKDSLSTRSLKKVRAPSGGSPHASTLCAGGWTCSWQSLRACSRLRSKWCSPALLFLVLPIQAVLDVTPRIMRVDVSVDVAMGLIRKENTFKHSWVLRELMDRLYWPFIVIRYHLSC